MIDVTRIQYPIGQGCFHLGTVEWHGESGAGTFRYIYDCGSKNEKALKRSVNAMLKRHPRIDALFVSHLHEDHVSGLERHLGNIHPNTVFIPHLSVAATVADLVADAADGAPSHSLVQASLEPEEWFGQRGVSRIVRVEPSQPDEGTAAGAEDSPEGGEPRYADISWEPREMRDGDTGTGPADRRSMKSGEMLAPSPGARTLDWVLVPHVDPESQADVTRFKTAISKVLRLPDLDDLTAQQLLKALRDAKTREKLRNCYKSCFKGNHNRVSMSVYSGPKSNPDQRVWRNLSQYRFRHPFHHVFRYPFRYPFRRSRAAGWIGTGDAHLNINRIRNAWERSYGSFLPNVSTLLLPHHGSNLNFSPELLRPRNLVNCVAAAGDPSRYPHPGIEVVESVRHAHKYFHHVSQKPGTLFPEHYRR